MKKLLFLVFILAAGSFSNYAAAQCYSSAFTFSSVAVTEGFENIPVSANNPATFGGWTAPVTPFTLPSGLVLTSPNPNSAGGAILGDWTRGSVSFGICNSSVSSSSNLPGGTAYLGLNTQGSISFTMPYVVSEIGLYVEAASCLNSTITLTAYNASNAVVATCTRTATGLVSNWKTAFLGLKASGISKITLSGSYLVIDNISFSPQAGALDFSGASDYVDIGSVLPAGSSYSKEAWVFATSNTCDNIISSNQDPFWLTSGHLSAGNGNVYSVVTDPGTFPLNTWTHVAVTYDAAANTMKLYKSGTLVASTSGSPAYSGGSIAIGHHQSGGCYFQGQIDEVRLWNRALCGGEIQNNMNCELPDGQTGLAAYYKFNQGYLNANNSSITTAIDNSGNGHDGTLYNFALTGSASNWVAGHVNGTCAAFVSSPLAAGSNSPVCTGSTMSLTSSGGFSSYSWTGPNGFSASVQNPVLSGVTAAAAGNYTVTGLNASGCSSTASTSVTINPLPSCLISGSDIVCPGASGVTYSAPAGMSSYTWTISGNGSITAGANAQVATVRPGATCNSAFTLTLTVANAGGCRSVCTKQITVQDITPPQISCPEPVSVNSDPGQCGANVSFSAGATDNCSTPNVSYSKAPGSFFPVGVTSVTVTATDACGNASSCAFTVTVQDKTPPAAVCKNITIQLDASGHAALTGSPVVFYNYSCDRATLSFHNVSQSFTATSSGYITQIGAGIGLWGTATAYGTTVSTPSNTVNYGTLAYSGRCCYSPCVAGNNMAFTTLPTPFYVNAGEVVTISFTGSGGDLHYEGGQLRLYVTGLTSGAALVDGGSTDACGIANRSIDKSSFDCSNVGNNNVTLTVTDVNGNVSSCTAIVTVEDKVAPVAVCKNITVQLDANGQASITANDVNGGSTDACGIASLAIDKSSFNCSNVGTNNVTLTVTDVNGNVSTCTAVVTVQDKAAPVAVCKNITVQLDANGQASITANDVNGGSTDACGIASISIDKSSFNCSNVGNNNVTLTVTDVNGNVTTCVAIVTVQDKVAPVAVCKNVSLQLNANGQASILANDVNDGSHDACGVASVSVSKTTFDCSNVGDNPVTLTVTDVNGNVSVCNAVVTVADNIAPAIVCPGNITTVSASASCGSAVTFATPQVTDNCSISISGSQTFDYSGSVQTWTVPSGVSSIHVTAFGAQGGLAIADGANWSGTAGLGGKIEGDIPVTSGSVLNIYVGGKGNNGAPSVAGTGGYNGGGNGAALASYYQSAGGGGGGASDIRLGGAALANRIIVAAGGAGAGTNCSRTYSGGNGGGPTGSNGAADCTGGATFGYGGTQSAGGAGGSYGGSAASAGTLGLGGSANPSYGIGGGGGGGYYGGGGGAMGGGGGGSSFATPSASGITNTAGVHAGNGQIIISYNQSFPVLSQISGLPSGSMFPVGTTVNTFKATDASGNSTTCSFSVTVTDNVAPVAKCKNSTVQLNANGQATIAASDVNNGSTDNCGIASVSIDKSSFNCSNVGTNNVTLTVTDVNGNVSTCTAVVTVQDKVAPVAVCKNITVQLDANGQASITANDVNGGSTDACGIASLAIDKTSFNCLNVGNNNVTLTVTDVNGNVSTCTAIVTVQDKVAPVAVCKNITVQLDANGQASITANDVNGGSTDACGIASLAIDKSSFNCSNVGTNNVTLTVTDVNGNVSTCTAVVTVQDKVAPVAVCKNITVQLDANGQASITANDVNGGSTDACGIASLAIDKSSFNCSNVGNNNVTLTVTDLNGNLSACTAIVTVQDKVAPVAVCKNITVQLDANGQASITANDVNGGSTDACGIASLAIDKSSFSCADLGTNPVVLTVTDVNGNVSTCNSTVTVADQIKPVFTFCPANIVLSACQSTASWNAPAAMDNCAVTVSQTAGPASGSAFANGTTSVITYTATDAAGNQATCSFTVSRADVFVASSESGSIACHGGSTTVKVTAAGGTSPYSGTGTFTASAGTYSYTVTDANGCTSVTTITLTEPAVLVASSSAGSIACNGGTTAVNVTATGGTAPYSGTGSFTAGAGTHSYTVTDANGCTSVTTVTITEPAVLVVNAVSNKPVAYYGYDPQACVTLTASAVGGTSPYSYTWSTGQITTSITVCPSAASEYTVTVKDANGCVSYATVKVCVNNVKCSKGGNNIVYYDGGKVLVCHVPDGDYSKRYTICIAPDGVADHLAHGDKLGICDAAPSCFARMQEEETGDVITEGMMNLKAYPNPFTEVTTIRFSLPEDVKVSVRIYNLVGEEVAVLYDGNVLKDEAHEVVFRGSDQAGGVYFCKLITASGEVKAEKLLLTK